MSGGPIVVAGASGFVGHLVVAALHQAGHAVRCGSRNPERAARRWPDWDWVHLDVHHASSLAGAFQGARAVVYLVHHLGRSGHDGLIAHETASAQRVLRAAEQAGIRRMVYLGAPVPSGPGSPHIQARLATGRVLRGGGVSTIELQAGMIIGAGSQSWLIVRDLALRLPVMVLPQWLTHQSEPIAIADVVMAITRCLSHDTTESLCLPLPGPEQLSARAVLERIAAQVGIAPLMIPVPVLTPSLSSHWIRLVTRADYGIARQLVDGLLNDFIATTPTFWDQFPELSPTPLDAAIAEALQHTTHMPAWQRRWESLVRRVARKSG